MMRQLQWTPSPSVLQSSASAAETDPSQLSPPFGYPARAKGSEAWLLPFQILRSATSCTGGAERRRRLGRVRLLDENPRFPPQRSSRKGST